MVFMYGFLVLLKIYADDSVNEMLVPANGLKVYGVFTTLNQFIVSISCIIYHVIFTMLKMTLSGV